MIPLPGRRTVTITFAGLLSAIAIACATTHPHLAPIDDTQIRIDVRTSLLDDERIDAETIRVDSRHGVVILVGVVASTDEARRALRHASRVSGVQQVVNRLRIVPTETLTPSDEKSGSRSQQLQRLHDQQRGHYRHSA
ncbi:MAG TPA: BON domain-containing protein [Acidobacteriota bacterium]|nr:BON domain-containing protein [Acidobacteriota bacterium]